MTGAGGGRRGAGARAGPSPTSLPYPPRPRPAPWQPSNKRPPPPPPGRAGKSPRPRPASVPPPRGAPGPAPLTRRYINRNDLIPRHLPPAAHSSLREFTGVGAGGRRIGSNSGLGAENGRNRRIGVGHYLVTELGSCRGYDEGRLGSPTDPRGNLGAARKTGTPCVDEGGARGPSQGSP